MPPPPSDRFEGWYQALVFLVLMAGAGAFAVLATRAGPPPEASATLSQPRAGGSEAIVAPAAGPTRLLVLVDTVERATELERWRHENPVADAGSFASVEISGPVPAAALEEAILFANVACAQDGCDTVTVVDLRGGQGATR